MAKTAECKTAAQVKKALKAGDRALIVAGAMIAMTLQNQPEAMIIVGSGAYLKLTLGSSQATVETRDSKSRLPDNITHIGGEEVATGIPGLLHEVAAAALAEGQAAGAAE